MTTNSHRDCDHDSTKAARAACRKLRAQGIDTTVSLDNLVAARLHRIAPDHTLRCCWHVTMAHLENHALDNDEDPTPELLLEQARNALGGLCYCD